ncbi:phospholipid transfer protein C2CD2L isoform X3 [Ischnura elegans]|uniref:phospholipid transfer protein C2CD2L isoform X3 n=1 Tax=Ischnura elegans TaxID=197161 RepID=UPI001ED8739F|nr:phospholipid transfer protein C2CD2L isoform X3 [Ischnura elegans]
MPDPVLMPIWNWLAKVWSNMADLADQIDDLICSFEGSGDTTMDTVAMLIFAWMVFGVFALLVGRYVYARFISGSSVGWSGQKAPVDDPAAVAAALTAAVALPPVEDGAPGATPKAEAGHHPRSVVPPTPPMRKRLSAKGPAPAPVSTKAPVMYPPPVTMGPEIESVKWVNSVFAWLYSDLTIVNDLVGAWIQSLNEATRKSVTEHGVGVEFVRVLPETHPPSLTNVFSDCAPNDDVTITCDCEGTPALQLKAFRQKGDKVDVSHYRVNVNRLRARLNIFAISEKLTSDLKFDGWPEVKVSLAPVGVIKAAAGGGSAAALEEEAQLREVIGEIVVGAIRATSFSWNMGVYGNCPRLLRNVQPVGHRLPLHYDSMMSSTADRRLLVKVMKATGIGGDRDVHEPYCVIELDDPPQKNQTVPKKGTNCPVWDEHFLYDLSPNSAEILFEIYDRGAKMTESKFLGLGIVGVEELMVNPSQRQVIALQSRPYEADDVTGSLTVEFLFIEGAEIPATGNYPSYKHKETSKTLSPSGKVITTTKTVFSKAGESLTNGGDVLTDSALRDLEARTRIPGAVQPSKSTLIIHSVQRQPQPHVVKVEQTVEGCWQEVSDQQPGMRETGTTGSEGDGQTVSSLEPDERGRSRRKRRDFFGTIKRRLGRSKTRSKSMDPGERDDSLGAGRGGGVDPVGVLPPGAARSISADRARDMSAHSTGRGLDGNSTRSSLSEASGVSGASTRTYVNEASTLVLETVENGIKRHYLVPITMATKTKWKKKGVKLHIYNDHTFVAKHLSGGTSCQVCTKSVARRIGKQGYECRDCNLKCHKHCHVKADNNCPLSTIHNIELVVPRTSVKLAYPGKSL